MPATRAHSLPPSLSPSRSPLNEDVFTPPRGCDTRAVTPEVVQLSDQIHRLLVQPVHSGSSQGYSSLGSSASRGSRSHERPHLSAASSSDSNGPAAKVAAVAAHNPVSLSLTRHSCNAAMTPRLGRWDGKRADD